MGGFWFFPQGDNWLLERIVNNFEKLCLLDFWGLTYLARRSRRRTHFLCANFLIVIGIYTKNPFYYLTFSGLIYSLFITQGAAIYPAGYTFAPRSLLR